jgi:hypothetical protein
MMGAPDEIYERSPTIFQDGFIRKTVMCQKQTERTTRHSEHRTDFWMLSNVGVLKAEPYHYSGFSSEKRGEMADRT